MSSSQSREQVHVLHEKHLSCYTLPYSWIFQTIDFSSNFTLRFTGLAAHVIASEENLLKLNNIADLSENGKYYPLCILTLQVLSKIVGKPKLTQLFKESKVRNQSIPFYWCRSFSIFPSRSLSLPAAKAFIMPNVCLYQPHLCIKALKTSWNLILCWLW